MSFLIGQDDWKKGRNRSKGEGFRMFCMTDKNVDALAKAIEQQGGKLDSGPRDQPWGVRDISLTDPDGFKITIAADALTPGRCRQSGSGRVAASAAPPKPWVPTGLKPSTIQVR